MQHVGYMHTQSATNDIVTFLYTKSETAMAASN